MASIQSLAVGTQIDAGGTPTSAGLYYVGLAKNGVKIITTDNPLESTTFDQTSDATEDIVDETSLTGDMYFGPTTKSIVYINSADQSDRLVVLLDNFSYTVHNKSDKRLFVKSGPSVYKLWPNQVAETTWDEDTSQHLIAVSDASPNDFEEVYQPDHGFSVGTPVYPADGGGWEAAYTAAYTTALGIVKYVVDDDTYAVMRSPGKVHWPAHGKNADKLHYLSPTPGESTTEINETGVNQFLFDVIDADTIHFYCWQPTLIDSSGFTYTFPFTV